MPPENTLDPTCCPLCGGPNGCAAEAARACGQAPGHCWCMRTRIPPAALAQVPTAARGRACICRACAEAMAPALVPTDRPAAGTQADPAA